MKHLVNFFSAVGFKLLFLLSIILFFNLSSNYLLTEERVFIFSGIFIIANLAAFLSFKVNGSYIISGITNCIIGVVLYFYLSYIEADPLFIYNDDLLNVLVESLKYGLILGLPTAIIGILLIKKRRKNKGKEIVIELEDQI